MKIGMIGSGLMAEQTLKILQEIDEIVATAIYCRSGSARTGTRLQQEYGIARMYHDIDEFLADESFDTVYIGVVNSMHYEFAKKSLAAGKHVICEKPFTSTAAEAAELAACAKEKKLFLFEAIMLRYRENYQAIREQLSAIGDLKLIQCNYSQYSRRYDRYLAGEVLPAFDPGLSGGSLYDINVYNVHFVTGMCGKPEAVTYFANQGYNGIDTSGTLVLDYGDYKAVCSGAKDSRSTSGCILQGVDGTIEVKSIPSWVRNVRVTLKDREYPLEQEQYENPLEGEFRAMVQVLSARDHELCYRWLEQSLIVMEVLEAARKNAGIRFAADQ